LASNRAAVMVGDLRRDTGHLVIAYTTSIHHSPGKSSCRLSVGASRAMGREG
jgi:hypothetical protein